MLKQYKNYIFDLYGTLVDIHTNEMNLNLWKKMAELYAVYGAEYQAEQLRAAFLRMDLEERDLIRARLRCEYPENQLEIVFLRLLKEWRPVIHSDNRLVEAGNSDETGLMAPVIDHGMDKADCYENAEIRLPENEAVWEEFMANTFRVLSRDYIHLFPETIHTLVRLREMGCHLYLLSNAQAIFTRPEIHELGLEQYFDKMYLSSDHGIMKPEPAYLKRLLAEEGLAAEETVMVGNEIRSDVKIADACGVNAILINIDKDSPVRLKEKAKEAGIRNRFTVVRSIGRIIDY